MDRGFHCAFVAVLKKFFLKKMYVNKTENV